MSDGLVWGLVAILMAPQIFMVLLSFAPKQFWRGLAAKNRKAAHYLWGFSHLFGPLSRPGEPPAWEKLP
jgi:hypothetical protein